MQGPQNIEINDFNYTLPEARIAKFPLAQRDESKLLIYNRGEISETVFERIPELLPTRSVVVFNQTKVIRARLLFRKTTGAHIELFCLEPHDPADFALAFQTKGAVVWRCIVGNLKKWKGETLEMRFEGSDLWLTAEHVGSFETEQLVKFRWTEAFSFADVLDELGRIPIPPYLKRESEAIDLERYQTVYAVEKGSVAAPTAGLHFTESVLCALTESGVETGFVTLHVGAGTFRPVKSKTMANHPMHSEQVVVSKKFIEWLLMSLNKHVIAVGTTTVRSIESLYWLGCRLLREGFSGLNEVPQWYAYSDFEIQISPVEAINAVKNYMEQNVLSQVSFFTRIIIAPGYQFRIVNGIVTNFHQPNSTLLLLVSAFIGADWRRVYDYALANDFRFLSYGDSSLLLP